MIPSEVKKETASTQTKSKKGNKKKPTSHSPCWLHKTLLPQGGKKKVKKKHTDSFLCNESTQRIR